VLLALRVGLLAVASCDSTGYGNTTIFIKNSNFHQVSPQNRLERCTMITLWSVHHLDMNSKDYLLNSRSDPTSNPNSQNSQPTTFAKPNFRKTYLRLENISLTLTLVQLIPRFRLLLLWLFSSLGFKTLVRVSIF